MPRRRLLSCHNQQLDCDDDNANVNPGEPEDSTDGIDNDCDGLIDENDEDVIVGAIVITEIMNNPSTVSDIHGEWFEIHNVSGQDLTLNGLIISDADGIESHQVSGAEPIVIASGDFMVMGINDDYDSNGGVWVDYAYSGISLGNESDSLQSDLRMMLDEVTGMVQRCRVCVSVQLDPHFMSSSFNDDGQYWCGIDIPTPGGINPTCDWVDHGGDGFLLSDGDCDDYDATSTYEAIDGDCDTVVTPLDCDDANAGHHRRHGC